MNLCFLPFLLYFTSFVTTQDTLLQVQAIFRHAARAPIANFSSDESQRFFFRGLGELSDLGIEQANALGKVLKQKYVDNGFLNRRYKPEEASFYSSYTPRCLMTASAMGSAMFDQYNYIPTPVAVTMDRDKDNICVPKSPSLVLNELRKMAGVTVPSDVTRAEELAFYPYMSWFKNTTYLQNGTLGGLTQAVLDEKEHGLTPPYWFNSNVEFEAVKLQYKYISFASGTGEFNNTQVVKCRSGLMLNTIMENMKKAINCTQKCTKFYAYSTHDTMIQLFLASFGMLDQLLRGRTAPFASTLVFELWNRGDGMGQFVKVFWWNPNSSFNAVTHLIYGCMSMETCPIANFTSCCNQFITTNPSVDCVG